MPVNFELVIADAETALYMSALVVPSQYIETIVLPKPLATGERKATLVIKNSLAAMSGVCLLA